MRVCGRVASASVRSCDNAAVIRVERESDDAFSGIVVHFVTPSIVRVRAVAAPVSVDDAQERSYIFTKTSWAGELDALLANERERVQGVAPVIREEGNIIEITSGVLTLRCSKADQSISLQLVEERTGVVLIEDQKGRSYCVDSNGRRHHIVNIDESDAFFGGGESCGPVNKRGHLVHFSPRDAIGHDPQMGSLYKHIPFWIKANRTWAGKRALGVFYHTTWDAEASFGKEISGYFPTFRRFTQNGGDIDVVYMYGAGVDDCASKFTEMVGRPTMLPKFALGYLGSTMYLAELRTGADDAHIAFVKRCADLDIPMDGWQLSSGYCTKEKSGKRCVFYWNKERWKDPGAWFAKMKSLGVVVSPNVKPGMLVGEHPLYEAFAVAGAFVKKAGCDDPFVGQWWGGQGSFVDFSNPAARDIWKHVLTRELIMKGGVPGGTASVWNDNNEYDSCVIGAGHAVADFEGKPSSMEQLRVVMPNLMSRCGLEAVQQARPGERPYIICRSGCTGIQRYAQVWGGDNTTSWKTLKWNVAQILSAGICGLVHYGCDVGGFHGPRPSAELLVRWVQQGIFQPRFSIHSCNNDNTVTLPWMYGEPYTSMIRNAIQLRYSLFCYLYSLTHEAHAFGSLLLRPLFYDFLAMWSAGKTARMPCSVHFYSLQTCSKKARAAAASTFHSRNPKRTGTTLIPASGTKAARVSAYPSPSTRGRCFSAAVQFCQ